MENAIPQLSGRNANDKSIPTMLPSSLWINGSGLRIASSYVSYYNIKIENSNMNIVPYSFHFYIYYITC